ncbi:unnamed protein product [Gadus morhua 'NCC']
MLSARAGPVERNAGNFSWWEGRGWLTCVSSEEAVAEIGSIRAGHPLGSGRLVLPDPGAPGNHQQQQTTGPGDPDPGRGEASVLPLRRSGSLLSELISLRRRSNRPTRWKHVSQAKVHGPTASRPDAQASRCSSSDMTGAMTPQRVNKRCCHQRKPSRRDKRNRELWIQAYVTL